MSKRAAMMGSVGQQIAGAVSELWTPTSTSAWYKGDVPSSILEADASGRVSQFSDLSGNGRHLKQVTAADQPYTGTETLNGLNGIDFTLTTRLALDVVGTTMSSVFIVFRSDSEISNISSDRRLIDNEGDAGNYGIRFGSVTGSLASEVITMMGDNTGRAGISSTNLASVDTTGHLLSTVFDTSQWFMGVDGSTDLRDLTTGTNFPVQWSSTHTLGTLFAGTVFELVMYNATLTSTDRERVEGYLAWKWGLVAKLRAGHPFKSAAPVT